MIHKILITLALALLLVFFVYPQKDSIISVFRMTDEPLVISKGNHGQSLIVEISFSHNGFYEWLQSIKQPFPLLILDADWIERSPEFVELIKKRNIPTGLLGSEGKEGYSIKTFNQELAIYQKHFGNKPLWFMTSDYEFPANLQEAVFNEEINLLSPTVIFEQGKSHAKSEGVIVSLPLHEQSSPSFKDISQFINSEKFISIEENIFGYTIKTKKIP